MSEKHENLSEAVAAVMAEVRQLKKGEENDFAHYKYVGIESWVDYVRPLMAKHGVSARASCLSAEVQGKLLVCHFEFCLAWGTEVSTPPSGRFAAAKASMGEQAYGTAESYALKNFLRAAFLMSSDENPDNEIDGQQGEPLMPPAPAKAADQDQKAALLTAIGARRKPSHPDDWCERSLARVCKTVGAKSLEAMTEPQAQRALGIINSVPVPEVVES